MKGADQRMIVGDARMSQAGDIRQPQSGLAYKITHKSWSRTF
jgi:hypothetical protein